MADRCTCQDKYIYLDNHDQALMPRPPGMIPMKMGHERCPHCIAVHELAREAVELLKLFKESCGFMSSVPHPAAKVVLDKAHRLGLLEETTT